MTQSLKAFMVMIKFTLIKMVKKKEKSLLLTLAEV